MQLRVFMRRDFGEFIPSTALEDSVFSRIIRGTWLVPLICEKYDDYTLIRQVKASFVRSLQTPTTEVMG